MLKKKGFCNIKKVVRYVKTVDLPRQIIKKSHGFDGRKVATLFTVALTYQWLVTFVPHPLYPASSLQIVSLDFDAIWILRSGPLSPSTRDSLTQLLPKAFKSQCLRSDPSKEEDKKRAEDKLQERSLMADF